jgi:hypothetical protein
VHVVHHFLSCSIQKQALRLNRGPNCGLGVISCTFARSVLWYVVQWRRGEVWSKIGGHGSLREACSFETSPLSHHNQHMLYWLCACWREETEVYYINPAKLSQVVLLELIRSATASSSTTKQASDPPLHEPCQRHLHECAGRCMNMHD